MTGSTATMNAWETLTTKERIARSNISESCPCINCGDRRGRTEDQELTEAQGWLDRRMGMEIAQPRAPGCPPIHNDQQARMEYIEQFGFAVPNAAALEVISGYGPLLEVAAGTGYWTWELVRRGVDIIATEPEQPWIHGGSEPWVFMERMSAMKAIRKFHDRNLLMCWPGYRDLWTEKIAQEFNGGYIVLIGENGGNGCTGTKEMYHILKNRFRTITKINIPRFSNIYDDLVILEKREKPLA